MSYQFTRYQPKYREEIVQLQTDLWGPDLGLNSAYLAWKYEQNPYLDEPLIYLALQNERVVGMRGFCGLQWEIDQNGQTVILPCAGDTIIAPEHRNRGLLRQLFQFSHTDRALAGFSYLLNFSANAPVYFCQLSQGWRVFGAYSALEFEEARFQDQDQFSRLRRPWNRCIQGALEPRPEDMASLVARTDRPDKFRQHKDCRYYAWRFRSPLSQYRFLYWQKTTLEGFLVLQRSTQFTDLHVRLIDWAASSPEVLTDLLQAAVQNAGLGGLEIWSATLSEAMAATLGEQGFTPAEWDSQPETSYRPALLGRCLNGALLDSEWILAGRDVTDLENWEIRMVCGDQY